MSLQKATQSPQISKLKDVFGQMEVEALAISAMNEISILSNSAMNADVQMMICDSVLTDFWYLRMDEFFLVLANGLKGKYGQIFGQLNYQTIYSWFSKHDLERNENFYTAHESNKTSTTSPHERSKEPALIKSTLDNMVDEKVNHRIAAYKKKSDDDINWKGVFDENL